MSHWLVQLKYFGRKYPRQFWLLFWGMLVSTIGTSMIWPFLMIYVSEQLHLPLAQIAMLLTFNSVAAVAFSLAAGPVIDRLGRKWVMVVSLVVSGLVYLLYTQAGTLAAFAGLQIFSGAFNPLYRVGADAMMADMIEPEQRVEAYSLMRLSNNVGVAIGPAMGGFIAAVSYNVAFIGAAAGMTFYGLLVAFFARETLPAHAARASSGWDGIRDYRHIFRDRPFMSFTAMFTITQISSTILWLLLSVYVKSQYGVSEDQYGFLPTTNAILVVIFQLWVTQLARRHRPLRVLALGSLVYGAAVGSVVFGRGFWGFWLSMVVMTLGEMMLMPTSTTYAADLAPAHMRGRYMSLYGLTWPVAQGIGPVLGGLLSDTLGPRSPWYGGFAAGLIAAIGFMALSQAGGRREAQSQPEARDAEAEG